MKERPSAISRRTLLKTGAAVGGAAALAPLIAACQPGASPQGGASPGATQAGPVTIRVWGFGLDDTRAKERLAVFQRANPRITIENAGGGLSRQQVLTAVASGDAPEVIRIGDRGEVPAYAGRNAIQDLDELIARDRFALDDFAAPAVAQVKYKNKTYGVPEFAHVELLYVNVAALEDAGFKLADVDPGNWDKMVEIAQKAHKTEGGRMTRLGWEHKIQDGGRWNMWAQINGVTVQSPDGLTVKFDDAKFIEVLNFAKRAMDAQGGDLARAAFNQAENFFSAQNYILTGQAVMRNFESWLIGTLKTKKDANITALVPRKRNSRDNISLAFGSAYAIPKGVTGAKRDAAWEFIKAFTSAEAWINGEKAVFAAEKAKNPPGDYHPTNSGNEKADPTIWNEIYKPISPSIDAIVKTWPDARKAAVHAPASPVQDEINSEMVKNLNDFLQGKKTAEKAAADIQKFATDKLNEYGRIPGNR